MSYWRYPATTRSIALELRELVAEPGALRSELRRMGRGAAISWLLENQDAVLGLIEQTPSQRSRRRDLAKDPLRRDMLALFGYCVARHGAALAERTERLQAGVSYRSFATDAASASLWAYMTPLFVWPFDDEPPFESWERVWDDW